MDTRVHKNTWRLPPKALSFTDITSLIRFIENYAEQHAILLPGRIPGYKKDDIKLLQVKGTVYKLPHIHVKIILQAVWDLYVASSIAARIRAAAYTTFCCYWFHMWLTLSHGVIYAGSVSRIVPQL